LDGTGPRIEDDWRASRGRLAREALLIVCLSLGLNLAGNDRVGLWDRDEPRYATCTREMRERGDWLYPSFNDKPRYHKPILIYWLMRAGYALGGDNPFGARLVSAIAGAATCLVVWRLGRSMAGPRVGLLAALALSTVPIMVAESKLATTDATLALLVVSAQACLWVLAGRDSRGAAAGFWVAMAMATLLKGPVGPVLVAASGVVSWWWGGPTACWRRLRWKSGLALFFVLVAPWYVAVGVRSGGEFFRFAVQTQIVRRLASGMEQHGGFPGYYAVLALPMFYPWSALIPVAARAAWSRRRSSPAFGFLLGWVVGPWLVLECSQTKLIHYYLPSFPACALLVAWLVVEASHQRVAIREWPLGRLGYRLIGILAIGGFAALGLGAILLPGSLRGPSGAMAISLGVGTLLARIWILRGETSRAAHALVGTWAVVMGLFGAWFLPAAEPYRFSRVVGERLGQLSAQAHVRPAIMSYQEPGVIYALGHPACDVRGYVEMFEEVRRNGPLLVPLLDSEVIELRADSRFAIEPLGSLSGFNANKGRVQTLEFAVVRAGPSTLAGSGKQALIK
jgi:4-amino-4-deoxy-L-arabinose transferase-like glycosyltransferase